MNVVPSKTYQRVERHRQRCPLWKRGFCWECFGSGLGNFVDQLEVEGYIKKIAEDD